jgi:hypothetical protein
MTIQNGCWREAVSHNEATDRIAWEAIESRPPDEPPPTDVIRYQGIAGGMPGTAAGDRGEGGSSAIGQLTRRATARPPGTAEPWAPHGRCG